MARRYAPENPRSQHPKTRRITAGIPEIIDVLARTDTIQLTTFTFEKQTHIGLVFKYNVQLLDVMRNDLKAKWSKSNRLWHLPYTAANIQLTIDVLTPLATLDTSHFLVSVPKKQAEKRKRHLTSAQKKLLNSFFMYLKGKRYSKSTVNVYTHFMADFVSYYTTTPLTELNNRSVEIFFEQFFIKQGYSISSQRQFISAIKIFIQFYPDTQIEEIALTRPKRSRKLPNVLSQEQIMALITAAKNLKHRAIITMLYSAGLRISELLALELKDIDVARQQLFIRNAKGRKDRYVSLSAHIIPLLRNYAVTYKPQRYFVEGPNGKPYSASSVRKFLSTYAKAAGITKHVSPHVLRHSYATHLLENGVGMRHIQELLGHAKPETTMIYTHVAKKDLLDIKSPLDAAIQRMQQMDNSEQKFLLSGE